MMPMLKKPNAATRAAMVEGRRLRGRFAEPRGLFRGLGAKTTKAGAKKMRNIGR